MNVLTYTRYELLRTFRNVSFFTFSLVFPLVLFYVIAGSHRHDHLGGVPFPTYYMAGMAGWGAMAAVVAGGARIAVERQAGWNRQLRLTPLPAWGYVSAKVVSGYALAAVSLVLIYAAGMSLGVHFSIGQWLTMTGLIIVALVPFAGLGVYIGHRLSPEAMGPAMGGIVSILALLGGSWGPVAASGPFHTLAQGLPSYWLVQAGQVFGGGSGWPLEAWIVIIAWSIVLGGLALRAFKRDTGKV